MAGSGRTMETGSVSSFLTEFGKFQTIPLPQFQRACQNPGTSPTSRMNDATGSAVRARTDTLLDAKVNFA
jgi:hypothetical protein